VTDFSAKGPLLNQLQSVQVVRCDEAAWRFLGISLAGYNVLISLALAAIAAFGLFARKPAS
jgi:disulfide bond formation protein DsbB